MDLIFDNDGVEHELVVHVTTPAATVGDLAAACAALVPTDALPSPTDGQPATPDLYLGSRRLDGGAALADAGIVRGVTVRIVPGAEKQVTGGLELALVGGIESGVSIPIADGTHVVGRGSNCDITLAAPTVSRRHCALQVTGTAVVVEDLGSNAGTFVDGSEISKGVSVALGPSSVVELGDVAFMVRPQMDSDRSMAVDPSRHATAAGEIPFNRPPRPAAPEPPPAVVAPKGPVAHAKPPFNLLAIAGPAVLGVVLALVSDPLYALMAIGTPVLALVNWMDARRRAGKASSSQDRSFRTALASFGEQLDKATFAERRRRFATLPDLTEVSRRASLPSTRLWERRPGHQDFLRLVAGFGDMPWNPPVTNPEYDGLAEEVAGVVADHSQLPVTPVAVELARDGPVGIVGPRPTALAVARSLLLQGAVHHGPNDLQIVVATTEEHASDWDWTKWLPHVRDLPAGDDRLLLVGVAAVNTFLQDRLKAAERAPSTGDALAGPLVLAVVDGSELTRSRDSQVRALLRDRRVRATAIVIAPTEDQLPEMCAAVVRGAEAEGEATIVWPQEGIRLPGVLVAGCSESTARTCARRLARYEDPEIVVPGSGLPQTVRITPLLGLQRPDPEAFKGFWDAYDRSVRRLAASDPLAKPPLVGLVGVTERGELPIDIVTDGPHGLVGGTTGSGKTELLRSFVLGLAAGASPRYLNMIFVDFKGGAGFEKLAELPHAVALETNLDADRARRSLDCLKAELDYRQRKFREAPEPVEELHRYWAVTDDPLPRLVVIIDEMAELISVLPDFSSALIRIGRIGRTLGVHLVMATQRPGSVVTPELKENTNWAIALRVRETGNSMDLVGVPDASAIPPKNAQGRALFRVGGDQGPPPVMFQSALSSARAGREAIAPVSVARFVLGRSPAPPALVVVAATEESTEQNAVDGGDSPAHADGATELEEIVDAMAEAYRRSGMPAPRKPWTEPLPDIVSLDDLLGPSARRQPASVPREVVLGLADDLANQSQRAVGWDLRAGNLFIIGVVGSGTTTALGTLAISISRSFPTGAAHLYVLDFGAGGLAALDSLPAVGAVVGSNEAERQKRLLQMLVKEINDRKADRARSDTRSRIFLLIDNFAGLIAAAESDVDLLDMVNRIFAEGPGVSVMVAATADRPTAVPYKLSELTTQKWVLRLADRGDYTNFGLPKRDPQSMPSGRAAVTGSNLLVQIARPMPTLADTVAAEATARRDEPGILPPKIGVLPDHIEPVALGPMVKVVGAHWFVPVGVGNTTLDAAGWKMHPGDHAVVAGPARSGKSSFLMALTVMLRSTVREAFVLGLVGRPGSPLAGFDRLTGCTDSEAELVDLLATASGSGSPAIVLIDDAHAVADDEGQLEAAIGGAGANVHFIVAGRTDELRSAYGHWTQTVRKSRTGLLLKVTDASDGDLLGARLPFMRSYDGRPGRGYIVNDGDVEFVQAALLSTPAE